MSANRFTSLRSRLLLLVIFAVVPALGLSLYTGLEERRLAQTEAEEAALRVARLAAGNQERLFEGARQLLITLAHLPEIQWGDREECGAFLAKLLKEHHAYANFGVADENGMIFASAIPIDRPVFAGDHTWFRRAVQTKDFATGDYQIGQITKMATLNFAYPIFYEDRKVDRVVYAALDLMWVNQIAAEAKLPRGAAITLIDLHGMILARYPDAQKLTGSSLPNTPLLREILARGKEGTAKLPGLDGVMTLNAFTPLRGASGKAGAYISVGIPVAVAFADEHRLLMRNLVLLGTVVALSIAAAWIFGNVFLLARVKELLRATTQLTSGNLRARTGLDYSEGELGQLARAFDEMAGTLELRREEQQRTEEALRESERRFRDLFEFSPDAVFVEDTTGNVLDVNAAGCSLIGSNREQLIGRNATELVPESIRPGLIHRLPEWSTGKLKTLVSENLRADGTTVPVELRASCIEYAGRPALLFHVRDITESKRAEKLRTAEKAILEMIATGMPLPNILEAITRNVDMLSGNAISSILLLDIDGLHLRHGAAPGLPDEYNRAVDGLAIGPNVGSCGTAAYRKEPVIVTDTFTDALWADFRAITEKFALRSCWSTPILSGTGEVLGTFALYSHEPRAPGPADFTLIERWTHLAGIAIERKRAEDALRSAHDQLLHAHDDLEDRVDERTAALGAANRALLAEVGERTRAEARLKEHAETVSDLYNNAPCGYHSLDKDGVFVRINDTELSWLGYARDEVVGKKKFGEFLTPESLKPHLESFPKFKEHGSVHDLEYDMVRKDGTIMPVLLNATAVKDADGNFVMSRSTVFDITERRHAERQLDRFFALSLNLLCVAGFDGFFKRLNPAWEKTLGFTSEELRARPYIEFIHPDDREATLGAASHIASGEPLFSFENRYRCKDGTHRWLLWQAAPSMSEQLIYAVALDITERKQAEERMRELQNFLNSIVENIPLMLFVKDAKNLRFVRVNKEEELLIGLPRAEMIGKTDADFFPREEAEFFNAKDREVLNSGVLLDISEEPVMTTKGLRIFHTKKIPILDRHGKPAYLLGISEDITERKTAEAELAKTTEELRRSNRELEMFAYVASHDLQEPLRMVASYTQLLQRRYQGKLDQSADEFIHFAVDGAKRMQAFINDLLQFSRVNTKGKPFAPVDLNEIARRVRSNLKIAIEETGAAVTFDPMPVLAGDDSQLTQLFQNLVGNALKFRKKDEPPRVHVSAECKGDHWQFAVTDRGIGIAPEYFEKIFVIFQRLHTRDEYPGTGIGLAVCKRIVERHGGRIWIESEPDKGAAFLFTIPVKETANEESAG